MRALILLFVALVASSCKQSPKSFACIEEDSMVVEERAIMGTSFQITSLTHSDVAFQQAFERAEEINSICSDYDASSELSRFNAWPAHKPFELSDTLYQVLATALRIAEKTDGAYDPALGALTWQWRETRRTKKLPEKGLMEELLAGSHWRMLVLNHDRKTLTKKHPLTRIDLGGIAKGFAVDEMMRVLNSHGIRNVSVRAGGEIRVSSEAGRDPWPIKVKSFNGQEVAPIILQSGAVSTSGDLHQFIEIEGIRYSHIIDPRTGLGVTEQALITVIASSSTLADALATACCIDPRVIEHIPDAELRVHAKR